MNLSLQSIKTNNWSADNLKKTRQLNELYNKLSRQYSQVTLVSRCFFWQLSIEHNMDVHKDVRYQVQTQIVYASDT